jgi:hypothetical protein
MTIWNWLFGYDASLATYQAGEMTASVCDINPATGLPMQDSCFSLDVGGNPYGVDWSIHADGGHATPNFGGDSYVDFGTD